MSIITVRCRLVAGIKQRIEKKSIGKFSKKDQVLLRKLLAAAESVLSQTNRIVNESSEQLRTIDLLFEKYVITSETEILNRSAISYLIRHGCKIKEKIEPTSKFTKWLSIKLKQAQRLKIQLSGHFPRGRNIQGQNFLSCLESVNRDDFSNEQDYLRWSIPISRNPPSLPHPIEINSNMDLRCLMFYRKHHKYNRGKSGEMIESVELIQRLFFEFKGLTQGYNYVFEVYCDRRQLSIFQQVFKDNQLWRDATNQQEQYSSSLFTLRSAHLLWERKEFQDRHRNETISTQVVDEPWNTHQLYLHCAIETKSLTAEGIKEIQQQKTQKMNNIITKQLENICPSIHQQRSYKKNQSSLALLERSLPRQSHPIYQSDSQIMVGLIFCPVNLIHLVIVNVVTGESIAYRSIRQLLGDKYSLLSEYRLKQKNNAHSRRKLNRRGQFEQPTGSNQAEYINRLIAKAVLKVTTQFKAAGIVLPFLNQTIEKNQSKLEAIAEEKFPEDIGTQKKLTNKISTVIHKQSCSVLSQYIKNNAAKLGISVETHPVSFVGSPIQQAKMTAITAYNTRNKHNK